METASEPHVDHSIVQVENGLSDTPHESDAEEEQIAASGEKESDALVDIEVTEEVEHPTISPNHSSSDLHEEDDLCPAEDHLQTSLENPDFSNLSSTVQENHETDALVDIEATEDAPPSEDHSFNQASVQEEVDGLDAKEESFNHVPPETPVEMEVNEDAPPSEDHSFNQASVQEVDGLDTKEESSDHVPPETPVEMEVNEDAPPSEDHSFNQASVQEVDGLDAKEESFNHVPPETPVEMEVNEDAPPSEDVSLMVSVNHAFSPASVQEVDGLDAREESSDDVPPENMTSDTPVEMEVNEDGLATEEGVGTALSRNLPSELEDEEVLAVKDHEPEDSQATETLQDPSHDKASLLDCIDTDFNLTEENDVNLTLPMDSAFVDGSTVAQFPQSDTLLSISKHSFDSDEDLLAENEPEEENKENGFSSSTLELHKKYATWDGRNDSKKTGPQNESHEDLRKAEGGQPNFRRRSHDNLVASSYSAVLPLALSQSFHMDFNTQLREMDEALKRAESIQKTVVDDDDKFPDSVTPIKVEQSLRDSGYDIPFIDDEAFYYQDWYVTEDHRWSRLEPSPHWMHAKSRFKGIAESEISTAASSPMKSVPTPCKPLAQSPARESIPDRQCPPPKPKKGLFSFFGCVSRTAT